MESGRYVMLTAETADTLRLAAEHASEDGLRRVLHDLVAAYQSSTIACAHRRFLRAGSARRCADCGSWV